MFATRNLCVGHLDKNMPTKVSKKVVGMIIRSRKTIMKDGVMTVRYTFVLPFSLLEFVNLL